MRNTFFPGPALAALALAVSACQGSQAPTPPEPPPVITAFAADKTQVTAGAAVKLSFTTERATEVELLDPAGNRVTVTGDASAGEATVNPTETSFYALRASGPGGRASAVVQVAVNEGLREVFIVVVPGEIESGQEVTLAWAALGGSGITVRDASGQTLSTDESGSRTLKLDRSTSFELRATGLLGPLSATANVKVRPVIRRFVGVPPAARQGGTIELQWQTLGAESVKVTEATFGEVATVTSPAAVDDGTLLFQVPSDFNADAGLLPDGGTPFSRPVPDNFPLEFTLTAATSSPPQAVTSALRSYVRDGPLITTFDVPAFGTQARPATVRWTLANAHRAEILLDGAPVFSTAPPASANASFTIPSLNADVQVTLVAYDFNGLSVRQTKLLRVAKAPKVNTFTLPGAVSSGGTPATAMWTTSNATTVIIRLKNGPVEFETQIAAMVSAGMTSLRPSRTTTYVLEAYNAAGDKDTLEKTITVSTPVNATASPSPTAPNSFVTLTWDVSGLAPLDVIGIPAEPPLSMTGSTGFVDIHGSPDAKALVYPASNDATLGFSVPFGFTFPVAGVPVSTFSASTNGFLTFGSLTAATAQNENFKGTTNLPAFQMVAPFWDDLDLLNDGAVEWMLEGQSFPRRLIVQWTNAHIAGDPSTAMTFQVQLFESGEIRFEYQSLTGTKATGESATVGVWLGAQILAGQFSFNTASLSNGLQISWFTNGAPAGTRGVVVGNSSLSLGFYYKTQQGQYGWVSVPVRVFGTNSVVVNEVMSVPALGVTEGQYVELYNATGHDEDLGGLEVSAASAPGMTFTIPPDTQVATNGYLVIGQSQVMADNGGAPVDLAYGTALPIASIDSISVKVIGSLTPDGGPTNPFNVNTYTWDAGVLGASQQRDTALGNFGTCMRSQMYGTAGSLGTPGALNESCFAYTLTSIPVAYEDISGIPGAGPLFSTTFWDSNISNALTLEAPFVYFGDGGITQVKVSCNGFVTTGITETNSGNSNKAAPSTSTPVGVIAPFWDDLQQNSMLTGAGSNVYMARSGNDRTVVQWKQASIFSSGTALLDFEVKLFDNGVIEFHYGDLVDTNATQADAGRALGGSATAWIESPDGKSALPISINQPTLRPFSAYRYTPKP